MSSQLRKGTFVYHIADWDKKTKCPKHIWSIDNHVMLCKWVQSGQNVKEYRVTNRYTIYNMHDLHNYTVLNLTMEQYKQSVLTGFVQL